MNETDPVPIPTESFVYHVPSSRNPSIKYRVDLTANGGAGWCACRDFACRRQPAIDAGALIHTRQTMCRHLARTFAAINRELWRGIARQEQQSP